jgi:hypothetical protein
VSVTVELTAPEMTLASFAGAMRRVKAISKARPAAYGYNGHDPWATDIESSAAEMVIAKHLDRYWSPLHLGCLTALPGDVGDGIQVRSTSRADGCLIVHDSEKDEHKFWLVITHTAPRYTIVGWMLGRDAKNSRWWRDTERPAYFVPQDHLKSPEAYRE